MFSVRSADGSTVELLCEAGDWIALPGGLAQAFDAGCRPDCDMLRLFVQPQGATDPGPAAPRPDLDRFVSDWAEGEEEALALSV